MNREIRFRAYDRKLKKMFPIHHMEFHKISNELIFISGVDIHDKDSNYEGDVAYGGHADKKTGTPAVNRFEMMQYTGLKDRNGKEIYEGDVVKGKRFDGRGEHKRFIGEVGYLGPSFRINGVGQYKGYFHEELHSAYEIIGNIYENPELLEADTDESR